MWNFFVIKWLFGKNVIIIGARMNSSVHIDNEKKDILILCKSGSDNTVLTAKKKDSLNFTEQRKKFF